MSNSNWNEPLVLTPKSEPGENHPRRGLASSYKKIILGLVVLTVLYFLISFGMKVFSVYTINKGVLTSQQVLEAVNKMMILPESEEPTIKTVTNLDEVKYQPFFMNAEIGDQVIIYSVAKKAILYRPSLNKIIEASTMK